MRISDGLKSFIFFYYSEGLSRMAVVIKMAGAGLFQSDVTTTHGEKGLVSTARRLARLSETARLQYGFRTVDTWNMTVARFRDFLPGRCRCHFHQVNFYFLFLLPLQKFNFPCKVEQF